MTVDPRLALESGLKAAVGSQLKRLYAESPYKLKHYDPKNPPDFGGGMINKRSRASSLRENTFELERKFTNPFRAEMQKKIEKYQMKMNTNPTRRSKTFKNQKSALAAMMNDSASAPI